MKVILSEEEQDLVLEIALALFPAARPAADYVGSFRLQENGFDLNLKKPAGVRAKVVPVVDAGG